MGNSKKSNTVKVKTRDEIVFTREYLEQGQTTGNTTITDNNYNGTIGLSMTGNSNRPVGVGINNLNSYTTHRWYKEIDITNYNALQFYSKKGQNHGSIYIYIDDEPIYIKTYDQISTSWTQHIVDLSDYEGKHIISIVGGYVDNTGSTSSNTQYCDILLTVN